MTTYGQSIYVVSSDGSVQVLDNASGSDGATPPSSATSADLHVPVQPLRVAPDGIKVYLPSGTDAEVRQGLASAITAVDVRSGAVVQTFPTSQPFRSVAFSPDGTAAYLDLVGSNGDSQALVRLDLNTGKETTLFQGEVAASIVVAP